MSSKWQKRAVYWRI